VNNFFSMFFIFPTYCNYIIFRYINKYVNNKHFSEVFCNTLQCYPDCLYAYCFDKSLPLLYTVLSPLRRIYLLLKIYSSFMLKIYFMIKMCFSFIMQILSIFSNRIDDLWNQQYLCCLKRKLANINGNALRVLVIIILRTTHLEY